MVGSFAARQADGEARQGKVGALGHSTPRCLLAGEGDERLAAPLATQVIQDEHRVRLELGKNRNTRIYQVTLVMNCVDLRFHPQKPGFWLSTLVKERKGGGGGAWSDPQGGNPS